MPKHDDLLYLAIDTSLREELNLALINVGKESITKKINKQAQDLQVEINSFLEENKQKIEDLKGFAITKNGPSLTGIRMGIVTVNTLGWLLHKPIIELENDFLQDITELERSTNGFKMVKQVVPNA